MPKLRRRRMANTGAHLVDRVLPDVPLRQYVLALPHELRMWAARTDVRDIEAALASLGIASAASDAVVAKRGKLGKSLAAATKRWGLRGASRTLRASSTDARDSAVRRVDQQPASLAASAASPR